MYSTKLFFYSPLFGKQGLKANVIIPLEEGHLMKSDFSIINEDSSNRKRSSSLTEQVGINIYDNYVHLSKCLLIIITICTY